MKFVLLWIFFESCKGLKCLQDYTVMTCLNVSDVGPSKKAIIILYKQWLQTNLIAMVFKSFDPCLFTINVFICDNYEATEILHLESIFLLQTHLISVAVGLKVALIP